MWRPVCLVLVLMCAITAVLADDGVELGVETEFMPEHCDRRAAAGDLVHVHYVGKLEDGSEFDNSYKRDDPISFKLGKRMVIAGWEEGILGMCVGEKRKLTIPPELGYGASGFPPVIPGGATLYFDTELVKLGDGGTAHFEEEEDETYGEL